MEALYVCSKNWSVLLESFFPGSDIPLLPSTNASPALISLRFINVSIFAFVFVFLLRCTLWNFRLDFNDELCKMPNQRHPKVSFRQIFNFAFSMGKGNCCTKSFDSELDHCQVQTIDSKNVYLIRGMEKWEAKISEATRDGKIVLANFSASWCRPCRSVIPTYCELADKYPSIIFLAIDVDELAELSTSWNIKATPTFVFLKDGRQIDTLVGANTFELQRKAAAMDDLAAKSHS